MYDWRCALMRETERAELIARVAHARHMRAGLPRERYVRHLERVARNVPDGAARATAWLHDVVEDTDVSFKDLKEWGVSSVVIEAVRLLTHKHRITHDEYLTGIRLIKRKADRGDYAAELALKVKRADIADNLGAIARVERGGRPGVAQMLTKRYSEAQTVLAVEEDK